MASGPGSDVWVSVTDEAPATWSMGMLLEQLIGPQQTAGAFAAAVVTQAAGQASPLHLHTREAEASFVLEGAIIYRVGAQTFPLGPGHFIYLPRGVPHAFRTVGASPTRYLALALPGGLFDLYDGLGTPAAAHRLPDGGISPEDVARWIEIGPRYGLRVVGPPIPRGNPA